jgi:predicted glutamine amidotransferase
MCQITLIASRSERFNKAALLVTATKNSRYLHKDGWGFFSPKSGIFKTKFAASELCDIGGLISDYGFGVNPIVSHVRRASKNIVVTEENVHPFQTDELVLVHNGTLWFEDELKDTNTTTSTTEESRPSDSKRFAEMLTAELKIEPDFVLAFNNCMAGCKGKYAMVIYVRRESKFYVCRGRTADLHIVHLSKDKVPYGFIVNTEKGTLSDEQLSISNIAQLLGSPQIDFDKEVKELEKETIYRVDGLTLTEVGKCPENPLPAKTYQTSYSQGQVHSVNSQTTRNTGYGAGDTSGTSPQEGLWQKITRVAEFRERERLSVADMDAIFIVLFNKPLLSLEEKQIDLFLKYAVGGLGSRKSVRDEVERKKFAVIPIGIYSKEIQFPLGLGTNFNEIERAIKKFQYH